MLLGLHGGLAWVSRAPGIETGQDDAVYVLLGRSLAQGSYRDEFVVGSPPSRGFPPGYPALLAGWSALFGERYDTLVVLSIACSIIALGLTFAVLRRSFGEPFALVSLAVLALNPYLVNAAGRVASEAPYTMCSALALWAVTPSPTKPMMLVIALGAGIAAALTRSIGVTLVIALLVYWLWQRRYTTTTKLWIVAGAALVAWVVWRPSGFVPTRYLADATAPSNGSTPSLVRELIYRGVHNAPAYLGLSLPRLLPLPAIPGTVLDNVAGILIAAGGMALGLAVFARRWPAGALYLVAYGTLLILWPWQVTRYVVPILGLAIPAVLVGVGAMATRVKPRWEFPAVLALGGVLGLTALARTTRMIEVRSRCVRRLTPPPPSPTCIAPREASFFSVFEDIEHRTAPDAIFVSAKAAPLFYYTRRKSLWFETALTSDSTSFVPALARAGAQYVLLSSLHTSEPRLAHLLSRQCQSLTVASSAPPQTYVFAIDTNRRSGTEACDALAAYERANADHDYTLGAWPP